jgi:hypothetical protein
VSNLAGKSGVRRGWLRHSLAAALFAAAITSGCAKPTAGLVSGTITVDAVPAKSGSIAFFPVSGKSFTSGAAVVDGKYSARVPFGAAKVEIRVPKVVGEKKLYDTADSPIKPILAEALPAHYNDETTLTIEVNPGENRHDFDLTTK